ncbi:MAG: hypothetical protein JSV98_02255 [candidate division WOR-3 bacterium]|nr:MAG: hypothetical protein JSV98_02255 [candidate division WOR-3 bacterium]
MKVIFHRGFGVITLVLSLIVVAIVVFIAMALYTGQGSLGPEDIRTPVERARSVECEALVRKVKIQVDLYRFENDRYPQHLGVLEGLSDTDLRCPVTDTPYQYDNESGRVWCPAHER